MSKFYTKTSEEKQIAKKGYTLEVTSWENDGDNYRTKSMTFDDLETVKEVQKLCKEVFCSSNNGEQGIGNMMDDDTSGGYVIANYLIENRKLLQGSDIIPSDLKEKVIEAFASEGEPVTEDNWEEYLPDYLDEDEELLNDIVDFGMDFNYKLMGGSEYYYSRVYESSVIFYSKEDLFLEVIK